MAFPFTDAESHELNDSILVAATSYTLVNFSEPSGAETGKDIEVTGNSTPSLREDEESRVAF